MKQKLVATILVLVLLSAGCKMGDPIIGHWRQTNLGTLDQLIEDELFIEFLSDGTYSQNFLMSGKWKRMDDSRLEIQTDSSGSFVKGGIRVVKVKIEGNVLIMTEPDGKSTKFKR